MSKPLKEALFFITFLASPIASNAQCDLTLGDYAPPGTYEVYMNPEKTEQANPPTQLATCEHLLQIEEARENTNSVVLEIENYIIVVTSREELQEKQLKTGEQ